jgi:hypothetical protein
VGVSRPSQFDLRCRLVSGWRQVVWCLVELRPVGRGLIEGERFSKEGKSLGVGVREGWVVDRSGISY